MSFVGNVLDFYFVNKVQVAKNLHNHFNNIQLEIKDYIAIF